MHNKILVMAVGLLCSGLTQAETKVNLYGRVDIALQGYDTPNGVQTRIESSLPNGSVWGIRGYEDVAQGLRVSFDLESGFGADTGALQNGLLFGRRATAALGGKFGTVHFGRRLVPLVEILFATDPLTPGVGLGFADTMGSTERGFLRRANNQIRYEAPPWHNIFSQLMYSFGETNKATDSAPHLNDVIGLSTAYTKTPWYLGYAYQQSQDGAAAKDSSATSVITQTTPNRFHTVTASYDFKVTRISGFVYWNNRKPIQLTSQSPVIPEIDQVIYSLGVSVPLGKDFLGAQLAVVKDNVQRITGPADATQWNIAYFHSLGPRTLLYFSYIDVVNEHFTRSVGGFTALSSQSFSTSQDSTPTLAVTARSRTLSIGFRHSFMLVDVTR